MKIRYIKKDKGIWPENYEKFKTDEIILQKGKGFENLFLYLEIYINFFDKLNQVLLLKQETGEVYQKYNIEEIEGIRYMGYAITASTLDCYIVSGNTTFLNEILNSKKEGWYTKNKSLKHYFIFRDTQIEILSKNNLWSKNKENLKINNIYEKLEKILILKKRSSLLYQRKYTLEFFQKEETENIFCLVKFFKKKIIKFMGIETYNYSIKKYFEDNVRYTRLYFLVDNQYKITIEYNSLEESFYLILKKIYRNILKEVEKDIFLLRNENSEFFNKCYNDTGDFHNKKKFKEKFEFYTYISDDYIIELGVYKDNLPRIEILDLVTGENIPQDKFLISI